MNNLTLGMMENELEESHRPKLEEVMNRFGHLKEYWVLVACFWVGPELHRRFMVFGKPPLIERYKSAIQATMCYYRNNGTMHDKEIKRIWVLLPDFPIPDTFFMDGYRDSDQNIEDDAKRLRVPVVYGG